MRRWSGLFLNFIESKGGGSERIKPDQRRRIYR
jgi:hypothetical protein